MHRGLTIEDVDIDGTVVPVHVEAPQSDGPSHDADVDPEAAEAAVAAEAAESDDEAQAAEAEATEAQAGADNDDAGAGDPGSGGTDSDEEIDTEVVESPDGPSGPAVGAGITFVAPTVEVPQIDGYRLRLVTTRALYDMGAAKQASPSLAKLPHGATLRLHPYDFDRLGVTAGSTVKVSNAEGGRGTITVPVEPSDGVPRGAALVAYAQPGGATAGLIDVSRPVTDVRVELAP